LNLKFDPAVFPAGWMDTCVHFIERAFLFFFRLKAKVPTEGARFREIQVGFGRNLQAFPHGWGRIVGAADIKNQHHLP